MITEDNFKRQAIDLVDKHFPKGEKNGRGEASVFASELILLHEEIINALYVRKTNTKKDKGENGRGSVLPSVFPRGDTPRSRMPGGSANGATYRVGTRLIPRGKKG